MASTKIGRADFAISRKESWETLFWLNLAVATKATTKDEIAVHVPRGS
jgi:hypothetical protein